MHISIFPLGVYFDQLSVLTTICVDGHQCHIGHSVSLLALRALMLDVLNPELCLDSQLPSPFSD